MDNKKDQQLDSYVEDSDEPELSRTKQANQVSQLHRVLEESKKSMIKFIGELGEKTLTPISQTILSQYNGQVKAFYTPKTILDILDKRMAKMVRNKKIKKNWNLEDIVLLLWTISKHIQGQLIESVESLTYEDWKMVSNLIPGSTLKGCMFKFISLKKVKLSMCNWSKEEEDMLKELVSNYSPNKWKQIAESLYENNPHRKIFRTSKQCREHWNCYLDPKLRKGPWTSDEDRQLLQNVSENKGQRKWSSIKQLFGGRTENALKNRYNLLIQRQRKVCAQNLSESELINQYLKNLGSKKQEKEHSNKSISLDSGIKFQQEEIFQDPVDEVKQPKKEFSTRKTSEGQPHLTQTIQSHIKSTKSSFKLSEAYQKQMSAQQNMEKQVNMGSMVLMSMRSASILPNEFGFYTTVFQSEKPN